MFRRSPTGFTLLEILVTLIILFILSAMIRPMTHVAARRAKEVELKYKLREVRRAIDAFKRDWDRDGDKLYGGLCQLNRLSCNEISGENGYPKKLEDLMEVRYSVGTEEKTKRYLRSIPTDPMTEKAEWGLRCYKDEPDATSWCGEDVFDVYSESTETALDGTQYSEW
jgi:general secretion pathway protein G